MVCWWTHLAHQQHFSLHAAARHGDKVCGGGSGHWRRRGYSSGWTCREAAGVEHNSVDDDDDDDACRVWPTAERRVRARQEREGCRKGKAVSEASLRTPERSDSRLCYVQAGWARVMLLPKPRLKASGSGRRCSVCVQAASVCTTRHHTTQAVSGFRRPAQRSDCSGAAYDDDLINRHHCLQLQPTLRRCGHAALLVYQLHSIYFNLLVCVSTRRIAICACICDIPYPKRDSKSTTPRCQVAAIDRNFALVVPKRVVGAC